MYQDRRNLKTDLLGAVFTMAIVLGLLSMTSVHPVGKVTSYQLPNQAVLVSTVTASAPPAPNALPGDGTGKANPPGYIPPAVAAVAAVDGNAVLALGRQMSDARFGDAQWPALYQLWMRESHWNPNARNGSSGACGIPQALPCSKITDHSVQGQIAWGLGYIASRYGTPQNAWNFWQAHRYY